MPPHPGNLAFGAWSRERWTEQLLARYNAEGPEALGDLRGVDAGLVRFARMRHTVHSHSLAPGAPDGESSGRRIFPVLTERCVSVKFGEVE